MSEEKISKLRKAFADTMKSFFKEQEELESLRTMRMSDSDSRIAAIAHVMRTDSMLCSMCELGISGAKIRNVSPEDIKKLMEESTAVSRELRKSVADDKLPETAFLISQFQLLQRKIIRAVSNMLSPEPLYEFAKQEAEELAREVPFERIEKILSRFHIIATQLSRRRKGKTPYLIDDEYDVQDLLHALLRLDFDDVQPEEWTPNYAGAGSKIDFVLRRERILIEVKKYGKNLTEKQIGDQLIVDIARYEKYPNVDWMICFIYDPLQMIENPRGFESDLQNLPTKKIRVRACVRPCA